MVDLHGHYNEVICLECGHRISRAALDERLLKLNPGFLDAVAAVTDIEIAPDADAVLEETAELRGGRLPALRGRPETGHHLLR